MVERRIRTAKAVGSIPSDSTPRPPAGTMLT